MYYAISLICWSNMRHVSHLQVNYLGPVALTKAVLPGMLANKAGHIVVISSVQVCVCVCLCLCLCVCVCVCERGY